MAPGQTVEGLFNERRALYEKYAVLTIRGGEGSVQDYARQALPGVLQALRAWGERG